MDARIKKIVAIEKANPKAVFFDDTPAEITTDFENILWEHGMLDVFKNAEKYLVTSLFDQEDDAIAEYEYNNVPFSSIFPDEDNDTDAQVVSVRDKKWPEGMRVLLRFQGDDLDYIHLKRSDGNKAYAMRDNKESGWMFNEFMRPETTGLSAVYQFSPEGGVTSYTFFDEKSLMLATEKYTFDGDKLSLEVDGKSYSIEHDAQDATYFNADTLYKVEDIKANSYVLKAFADTARGLNVQRIAAGVQETYSSVAPLKGIIPEDDIAYMEKINVTGPLSVLKISAAYSFGITIKGMQDGAAFTYESLFSPDLRVESFREIKGENVYRLVKKGDSGHIKEEIQHAIVKGNSKLDFYYRKEGTSQNLRYVLFDLSGIRSPVTFSYDGSDVTEKISQKRAQWQKGFEAFTSKKEAKELGDEMYKMLVDKKDRMVKKRRNIIEYVKGANGFLRPLALFIAMIPAMAAFGKAKAQPLPYKQPVIKNVLNDNTPHIIGLDEVGRSGVAYFDVKKGYENVYSK